MAFERFTTSVLNVSALPDRVTGQATTLKAVFDKAGVDIKTALNGLMEQLEALTAAGNIGAEVDSTVAHTVQGILTAFDTAIGNRYTKAETDTLVASETNNLVKSITFNSSTGVFTITKADDTTTTIDTALEKVPATFELIESSGTYYLRITNLDGTYTQTNVTELMNVYTFNNSDTIAFSETTSGNTKTLTASIRDNSITMDKLALSALSSIQGYVEIAEDSAAAASTSATNASASATAAGTSATNASASATAASQSATSASESANTASTKATQASNSAAGASGSAGTATSKATEAQSWAVGGTGTRTGEDTNNAKYWCEQAEGAVAGGDMLKSVYDTDNDGIVDNSEALEGHAASYFQQKIDANNKLAYSLLSGTPTIPDELADLSDDSTHRLVTDIEKTTWDGKANKATFTATIPTTGWSASAPYTQTISVTGMLATDANFPVSPVYSSALATRQAQQEAWGKVSMIEAGADSITVTCDEEVPTEAIPIQIMVVR